MPCLPEISAAMKWGGQTMQRMAPPPHEDFPGRCEPMTVPRPQVPSLKHLRSSARSAVSPNGTVRWSPFPPCGLHPVLPCRRDYR